MISLLLAYALMVLSQTSGPEIIGFLHGQQAKEDALSIELLVLPDSQNLCAEYEAAHFDPMSDILHCGGMLGLVLLLLLLVVVVVLKSGTRKQNEANNNNNNNNKNSVNIINLLLWAPPIYYLPAWVGHFVFQKDIPAVFSYGTTLSGWWTGESCAFLEVVSGRALSTLNQWICSMALATTMVYAVAVVPPLVVDGNVNHGSEQDTKKRD